MSTGLIPREIIFGNPTKISPQISPDGSHLAYIAPLNGVLNIWIKTIGKDDDKAITNDTGRGIRGFFFTWDNEHILYVQDKDGDENWHVYSIPKLGGEPFDLTPIDGVQARIMSNKREFPNIVLIAINDRIPQLHDIYSVDLRTNERTLIVKNEIGAIGWSVDDNLNVRLAQVQRENGGQTLFHRLDNDSEWEELLTFNSEDALTTHPAGFNKEGDSIYIISSIGSDTAQLRELNLKTRKETTLISDPDYDISDMIREPFTKKIQAAQFNRDRINWEILDSSIKEDFKGIYGLTDGDLHIIDQDFKNETWIVAFTKDNGSTPFYIWDRTKKQGEFLFAARPEIDQWDLAPMKPIAYQARDGLTIHGYLTTPYGKEPKNLPAIVVVHGGPWVRDDWGLDPESQWLANRGYAVLQINYRGSTGYGKSFINAGDKEWGGKMQDDVSDGVKWLIEQGIADAKRVGIFGGSYGGFAVLSGLTKTPELYACGVDIVGPSNLITFQETIPPYWEPLKPQMYKRIGHPVEDGSLLYDRSPLNHIDNITAPLMIVQGKNDPRVKRSESVQIKHALEKAGKVVEYMEFEDEGHGFARPENRLKFYGAAEKFLADHLGGDYLP